MAAQGQSSYHINTAESMNTAMLSSVMRDRNNNMWIASYNGLYKHEGSRIRAFNKTGRDDGSLSGSEVHALFEDRLGFIWVGTANGLDKIHPVTYRVQHYPLRLVDGGAFAGTVYCIFQDKDDLIWASTDAAMFKLTYRTGAYTTVPQRQDGQGIPSPALSYKSAVVTEAGIWMYTQNGLVFYDYATRSFFHRYYNPSHNPVFNLKGSGWGNQSDLRMDKGKNLWFVSDTAHLVRYNVQSRQLDSFSYERPKGSWRCCYSLAVDYKDRVWLGFRYGGIKVFNPATKEFTSITTATAGRLLQSNYVWSLEEDYRKQMWVSTHNGLDIIDLDNGAVRRLFLTKDENFRSFAYQMITPVADGDSVLYLPFYRFGFMRVNLLTDSIGLFPVSKDYPSGTTYVLPRNGTTVWAARDRRMLSYDLQKKSQVRPFKNNPISDSILTDIGDVTWHYANDTLLIYRTDEEAIYFRTASGYRAKWKGYGAKKNVCVSPDKKTFWYLNDSMNLVRRNLANGDTALIRLRQKLKVLPFSFADPRNILDDGEAVWLTGRNGLLRYQYATGKLSAYTVEKGLVQNFTFSLCVDAQQNLWVGSLGGIDVYDRTKDLFQNIIAHPTESLMDAFGEGLAVKNKLCFISGNKLFLIDPVKALAEKADSSYTLALQEVMVNGQTVDWKTADLRRLSYKENDLLFRFGLLDYTNVAGVNYQYYLEGLDETWMENRVPGEVSYNALAPNRYVFHLRGVDVRSNAVAAEIRFPFEVQPPFWQRWWFTALMVSVAAFIIYQFYRRRIGQIKKRAAIKQQLTELESKALRAQMNPHFIFNSLNAIQELVVTKNVDAAYDYLSRFSKLLRQVLNNSEKPLIPLSDELSMLRLYLELESLRFRSAFVYTIEVDESLDAESLLVPPLLLQPFIENALWHGLMLREGEKKLVLTMRPQAALLLCTVTDNGIGRKKAQAIKEQKLGAGHFDSKGMQLSRQRIELLKQDDKHTTVHIDDLYEAGKATGTRVVISLPLVYA